MKLLLDQNLPHGIRHELPGHAYMGWDAIENGELLRLAAQNGFDALITNDRGLEYEQNLGTLPVAVVIVLAKSNTIEAIRPLDPDLLATLAGRHPGELAKVSAP